MAKIQDVDIPYLEFAEAAAPGTPASGIVRTYSKSDGLMYSKDDAGVETLMSGGGSGGGITELDYVQFTSSVNLTATTEATANTIVTSSAIAYSGSQIIMIEFFCSTWQTQPTTDAVTRLYLYDGSSSIGRIGTMITPAAGSLGVIVPCHVWRRLTPSAATHTYSIRGDTNAGTAVAAAGAGGSGNIMPGFIRITEV